jgi:hypothetical protein
MKHFRVSSGLTSTKFQLKEMGPPGQYETIWEWRFCKTERRIHSVSNINQILKQFEMENYEAQCTPMAAGTQIGAGVR